MPSYTITNEPHRRRDEITGIGSGLGVAGKVSFIIRGRRDLAHVSAGIRLRTR